MPGLAKYIQLDIIRYIWKSHFTLRKIATNALLRNLLQKLQPKDRAKVLACLKNVEELGFDCPRVEFRQIRGQLWEIKIKTTSGGLRFFYVFLKNKSNTLVLLHAYKKQSQKAPKNEIEIAEQRMMEVLDNEKDYS